MPDYVEDEPIPLEEEPGRFAFKRSMKAGGFAHVYEASDRSTKAIVVVKVMRPPKLDSDLAQHADDFMREAKALRRLRHPGIMELVHWGWVVEDAVRVPALVMEYADGGDLAERLGDQGEWASGQRVDVAVRWMRQLLQALSHAHLRGVLHRDIKPENVFISGDRPKLGDFGLAKFQEEPTRVHSFAGGGSWGYIAPEVFRSEAHRPPSDIYSLGLVFYALLTGAHPFRDRGADRPGDQYGQKGPPPPVRPRDARPDVPEWVDAAVDKMTAFRPEHRYQSAWEALQSLWPQQMTVLRGTLLMGPNESLAQCLMAALEPWHKHQHTECVFSGSYRGAAEVWFPEGLGRAWPVPTPAGGSSVVAAEVELRLESEGHWAELVPGQTAASSGRILWRELEYTTPGDYLPIDRLLGLCRRRSLEPLHADDFTCVLGVPTDGVPGEQALLVLTNLEDDLLVRWRNCPFAEADWVAQVASPAAVGGWLRQDVD